MLNLGVLASGRGSNFQSIINEIEAGNLKASIRLLITDNPDAYVIDRAKRHSVEYLYLNPCDFTLKDDFYVKIADELKKWDVEIGRAHV
jgi:phosphoribosylglycinamide formyltransferase-1